MAITQTIHLHAGDMGVTPMIHAVQGDTGRILSLVLEDYTLISGTSATCWFTRPDGSKYSKSGTISVTYNTVTVDLSAQGGALTQVGSVKSQLVLTYSGAVVSTFDFIIVVEESEAGTAVQADVDWKTSLQADLQTEVQTKLDFGEVQTLTQAQRTQVRENIGIYAVTISAGTTTVFTIASNTRATLTTNGAAIPQRGMWIVSAGAGGQVGATEVLGASNVTINTDNANEISIQNTHGGNSVLAVFDVQVGSIIAN